MKLALMMKSLAVAATLAFSGATAHAFTVNYQTPGVPFGTNGRALVTANSTGSLGAFSVNTFAGALALKGDVDGNGFAENFTAFCLELTRSLRDGSEYVVTAVPFAERLLTATQLTAIQKVFDAGYSSVDLSSNDDAAGFQLALWELVYEEDAGFSIGGGTFTVTAAASVLSKASDYLALLSGGPAAEAWDLHYLQGIGNPPSQPRSQNLVTPKPVPLPAAGVMLLVALGGLGLMRRRRAA